MKTWLKNRYASYTADGKFWLTIGTVCLIVDMAIGYMAGISQATFWHGVGAAMLAAGFAFLPDAAYEEYEHRRLASAVVLALVCIPIGIKAYEQQLTYSAGMRHGEIKLTNAVNRTYTGAQDNVTEGKANLTLWQKQLEELQAQAPWAATVKAEALRGQVAVAQKEIDLETARGGCKTKCAARMKDKADLEERIGKIEQMADLTSRIEATKRVLDGARTAAAKVEPKLSLNEEVAKTTAQLVKLMGGYTPKDAIETDAVAMQYATLGSAGLGSLALLIMAPVGFFLAGRRRKAGHDETAPNTHSVGEIGNRTSDTRAYQPQHLQTVTRTIADLQANMRRLAAA